MPFGHSQPEAAGPRLRPRHDASLKFADDFRGDLLAYCLCCHFTDPFRKKHVFRKERLAASVGETLIKSLAGEGYHPAWQAAVLTRPKVGDTTARGAEGDELFLMLGVAPST